MSQQASRASQHASHKKTEESRNITKKCIYQCNNCFPLARFWPTKLLTLGQQGGLDQYMGCNDYSSCKMSVSKFMHIHFAPQAISSYNILIFLIVVVCGSDDNTYASTCHMLVESRRQVPRVRHPGSCRAIDTSRMVRYPKVNLIFSNMNKFVA